MNASSSSQRPGKAMGSQLWLIVSIALATALALLLYRDFVEPGNDRSVPSTTDFLKEISSVSRTLSREVGKSVVRVEVRRSSLTGGTEPVKAVDQQSSDGQGSGIVVSDTGLVLTNYHVVEGAESITLAANGVECTGTVLGSDALTDLALVQAHEQLGPAIVWGDSDTLAVGDFVWAIGNPFGLDRSVTFGIVSAVQQKDIAANQFQEFFQTDAAVNPGNSGGPVVNGHGEVVGINSAIVGESYRGISFAIPSNTAREVLGSLRRVGRVPRGWLGVQLNDLSAAKVLQLQLPDSRGALVEGFSDSDAATNSPARAAGIRIDDVVLEWKGTRVESSGQLGRLIGQTRLGTVAKLTLWRDGQRVEVDVTIGERR